jgi:hypothetical protein
MACHKFNQEPPTYQRVTPAQRRLPHCDKQPERDPRSYGYAHFYWLLAMIPRSSFARIIGADLIPSRLYTIEESCPDSRHA